MMAKCFNHNQTIKGKIVSNIVKIPTKLTFIKKKKCDCIFDIFLIVVRTSYEEPCNIPIQIYD